LRDHGPPEPSTTPLTARQRRWVLCAAMLAMFMAAVESTIVSTAMPTIVAALGGFHLFSWVFAAYLLPQAVTVPIYGRLADLYGRKRVLLAGATIFLVGSALCGLAWGMPALVVFRALQGLGAGAIMPVATTIVGDIYPPSERGRVQGYISSLWGVSAVTGPLLGAFLVQHVGWATVFWVNLPVGCLSMALLVVALHEHRAPRRHRIDYVGSLLLAGSSGALILALVQAGDLGFPTVVTLVIAAVLGLLLLLRHEGRVVEPMMPLDLWRHPVIAAVNLGALSIGAVMMGVVVFLPTCVQGVMGRSALVAGFALTALSLGWPIGSTIAGRLLARRSYRALSMAGGVALVAGGVVLVVMNPTEGAFLAGIGALLTGLGLGFCNTTFLVAAQASVRWNRRGIATSTNLFMRMLGQSLGAAIFGGIVNHGLARRLPDAVNAVERLMNPAERAAMSADTVARLTHAVAVTLHQVYVVAALLALLALALTLILPPGIGPRHAEED